MTTSDSDPHMKEKIELVILVIVTTSFVAEATIGNYYLAFWEFMFAFMMVKSVSDARAIDKLIKANKRALDGWQEALDREGEWAKLNRL